jgi:GAF domain-containing protein/HAMP domain-containing protein
MNEAALLQTLQMAAWTLGLAEAVMGLYTLALNVWSASNRRLGLLLLFLSVQNFALGFWLRAETVYEARPAVLILALSLPAVQPLALWTAVRLAREQWTWREGGALRGVAALLILFPWALTVSDLVFGTRFWYTGLPAGITTGTRLGLLPFTAGRLAYLVRALDYLLAPILAMGALGYVLWKERTAHPETRHIAGWLLAGFTVGFAIYIRTGGYSPGAMLLSGAALFLAFGYAGFKRMGAERHLLRGNLQTRLTLLTLAVSLPVLGAITFFTVERARGQAREQVALALESNASAMASNVRLWLDHTGRGLRALAPYPLQTEGDDLQIWEPALEQAAQAYPDLDWMGVVDLQGKVLAQRGSEAFELSGQSAFFREVLRGENPAITTFSGVGDEDTLLVTHAPLEQHPGQGTATGIFIIKVNKLAALLHFDEMASGRTAYLVDAHDQAVLATNLEAIGQPDSLQGYSALKALREGARGRVGFVDASGRKWAAAVERLPNDWGLVVQTPEVSLAPATGFLKAALVGLGAGALLLLVTVWISMRQGLEPIRRLTETATLISTGDLTRMVAETSQDEIGLLAHAFNTMTDRLREMISRLERRVAERTEDLEHKALQLQVTADVAREAAAIHDLEYLLGHVVNVISERFDFYHAGIFLLDDERQYAVLRAASSQGGRQMLARGHRLEVGRVGIVGHVASQGEARIALDVGTDAVFFDNPDLPLTRSEAGLPLVSRGEIIGVLDVQSRQPAAFSNEDLEVLQLLADQVALAIDNARLLRDSQQALEELQALYSQQVRQAWEKRLDQRLGERGQHFSYRASSEENSSQSALTNAQDEEGRRLEEPIVLRGVRLGTLELRRAPGQGEWLPEERQLAQEAVRQMALSIENARLLEEVQQRAYRERMVGEIAAQAQGSLDLEGVMRTTVEQVGKRLGATRVRIWLEGGGRSA